jgi:hypothetical protein
VKPIDHDALLAALVMAPATYSRNRFFQLYADPEMGRVRRRAAQIRGLVRQITRGGAGDALAMRSLGEGRVELSYALPALGLKRTSVLDPVELALVRFCLARAGGRMLAADDADRVRVEAALRRLAPAFSTDEAAPAPTLRT